MRFMLERLFRLPTRNTEPNGDSLMTANTSIHPAAPAEDDVRRQIAHATLRLRRYRLARDRARAQRLQQSPRLRQLIASLLKPTG